MSLASNDDEMTNEEFSDALHADIDKMEDSIFVFLWMVKSANPTALELLKVIRNATSVTPDALRMRDLRAARKLQAALAKVKDETPFPQEEPPDLEGLNPKGQDHRKKYVTPEEEAENRRIAKANKSEF